MTAIEIPNELAEHLKLYAQQLHIPFDQFVISVLQKSLYPKHGYFLTPEQFAFMREHNAVIEQAYIDFERGRISGDETLKVSANAVIDEIIQSEAYKQLFGDMGWDDALDSYQDTPGYDNSLRVELRNQLNREIASGVVKRVPQPMPESQWLSPEVLEKLKKMKRDE